MKINKYIGLAVCALMMASCQNDEVVSDQPLDNGLQTLIGQIGSGDADSRAQIQLGNPCNNGLEIFFWNEEDRFTLYQNMNGTLASSEFVISEEYSEADGGDLYSEFTTADKPATASYVAVYPHTVTVDSDNTVKLSFQNYLDFSVASKEEVWKNYFKKNMYMIASGTLKESGSNLVNFQHQCALIRITYTNKTSGKQTVSGIGLGGGGVGFGAPPCPFCIDRFEVAPGLRFAVVCPDAPKVCGWGFPDGSAYGNVCQSVGFALDSVVISPKGGESVSHESGICFGYFPPHLALLGALLANLGGVGFKFGKTGGEFFPVLVNDCRGGGGVHFGVVHHGVNLLSLCPGLCPGGICPHGVLYHNFRAK